METETWDSDKLREFINHYGLRYKDVANGIGCSIPNVHKLIGKQRAIESFAPLLTAYKEAVKQSKIAGAKAYCEGMVKHYEGF